MKTSVVRKITPASQAEFDLEDMARHHHARQCKSGHGLPFCDDAVRETDPLGEGTLGVNIGPVPLDLLSIHRDCPNLNWFDATLSTNQE